MYYVVRSLYLPLAKPLTAVYKLGKVTFFDKSTRPACCVWLDKLTFTVRTVEYCLKSLGANTSSRLSSPLSLPETLNLSSSTFQSRSFINLLVRLHLSFVLFPIFDPRLYILLFLRL